MSYCFDLLDMLLSMCGRFVAVFAELLSLRLIRVFVLFGTSCFVCGLLVVCVNGC